LRISWTVVIQKAPLQLMDARTFVRNHDGIKTGYTEDVPLRGSDGVVSWLYQAARTLVYAAEAYRRLERPREGREVCREQTVS
jgi:hypothetical protein